MDSSGFDLILQANEGSAEASNHVDNTIRIPLKGENPTDSVRKCLFSLRRILTDQTSVLLKDWQNTLDWLGQSMARDVFTQRMGTGRSRENVIRCHFGERKQSKPKKLNSAIKSWQKRE